LGVLCTRSFDLPYSSFILCVRNLVLLMRNSYLYLDIMGIACSGGSACSSGSNIGSHVLSAIAPDSTRPGVRFSFSKYNTKEEIDYVIEKLKDLFN